MYKIALVCRFGASTSLLASKIEKECQSRGMEAEVRAYPEDILKEVTEQNDVVLIGPQIQYRMSVIKKELPECIYKFVMVTPTDFGTMNAKHILDQALEKISEIQKSQDV